MIANFYSVVLSWNATARRYTVYRPLPTPHPPVTDPHLPLPVRPLPLSLHVYARGEPRNAKEMIRLLLDLREDLRVAEEEVLLRACEGRVSDQQDVTRMPTHADSPPRRP